MLSYAQIDSPLGPLLLAADETGLRSIDFVNGRRPVSPQPTWREDPELLREPIQQLHAYFAGDLEAFDLRARAHCPSEEANAADRVLLAEIDLDPGLVAISVGGPLGRVVTIDGAQAKRSSRQDRQ